MDAGDRAAAGIVGLGLYLPEEVRGNDWWPESVVASWQAKPTENNPVAMVDKGPISKALGKQQGDPFGGAVERRVVDPEMTASQMEIEVGRRALISAGVDATQIELLLVNSWMPTLIGTNDACTVHEGLGLPTRCMTLTTESSFNGFQQQVTLAEAMIRAGRIRYALLVQSCTISRFMPYEMPFSPWFGDGASAVVVGPATEHCEILGSSQRSDGSLQGALMTGIPGKKWYDEGRPILYVGRAASSVKILDKLANCASESCAAALAQAKLGPEQVQFYASHQPTPWFRSLTQNAAGLEHANAVDTFAKVGSLGASSIPASLHHATQQGVLNPGDIVVTHSGGSGGTWGSLVLRWGVEAKPSLS